MFIRIPEEFYYETRQTYPQYLPESALQTLRPPTYIPDKSMLTKLKKPGEPIEFGAVDVPNLKNCIYKWIFLTFTDQKEDWMFLTYVGPQSIGGYRYLDVPPNPHFVYKGYSSDRISSFWCDPTLFPELLKELPIEIPIL